MFIAAMAGFGCITRVAARLGRGQVIVAALKVGYSCISVERGAGLTDMALHQGPDTTSIEDDLAKRQKT